jgi:hypothetical protein
LNTESPIRVCEECEESIPPARLKAVPNARMCVPCLEGLGDVPRIKKFEEHSESGELLSETFFTKNPYIEHQIGRLMSGKFNKTFKTNTEE